MKLTYREALRLALREEMHRDPSVFLMGEEVGVFERGIGEGTDIVEKEMFTVPDIAGATMGASLERYELNGKVIWGKTGARPGYHTVVAATRDLSRTVVYSVNSTDAKGDGLAIVRRFAFPAFNR